MTQSNILTISGWGQNSELISKTLNHPSDFLAYHQLRFEDLKLTKKYDLIIGWSLGGQIALALAKKYNIPKLILLTTPYKFENPNFAQFKQSLKDDPKNHLKEFKKLIAFGDKNFKNLLSQIPLENYSLEDLLYWLNFLNKFSAQDYISYTGHILSIYAGKDNITPYNQGKFFEKNFANLKLEFFKESGHAVFLHDSKKFNKIIDGYFKY